MLKVVGDELGFGGRVIVDGVEVLGEMVICDEVG